MRWQAIVLAAGRGPDDPMAAAYRVSHKCLVEVAGVPMLRRVVTVLHEYPAIDRISIAIDDAGIGLRALGETSERVRFVGAAESAARSLIDLLDPHFTDYPVLVTTADHPLLTGEMISEFIAASERSGADLTAGLARAETILAAHPEARRTFLRFGPDSVSGCNLFAILNPRALAALDFWHYLEPARKKPWRLVAAFGPGALLRFAAGGLDLDSAFALASRRLRLTVKPVILPFAEAAIDVDKPADKELAERILKARALSHQRATR